VLSPPTKTLQADPQTSAPVVRKNDQPIRPTYAGAFRCIGPSCEDHCCGGWSIPVDKQTYEKYLQFPAEGLGAVVSQSVSIVDANGPPELYARINLPPSGLCAFFESDRLCSIQKQYGEKLLPTTCSVYPRTLNRIDGALEGSLSLSCPEAARNVLLVPDSLLAQSDLLAGGLASNFFDLHSDTTGIHKPRKYFHAIRSLLVAMVRDRARPVWQRLLLVGVVCERLAQITSPEQDELVPAILEEYRLVIERVGLKAELDALPSAPELQLEVILRMTIDRMENPTAGPRFRRTCEEFLLGIGYQDSTPADRTQRYLHALRTYHQPFFEKYPFILENYILNTIFQTLFPFGRSGSQHCVPQTIMDEYILMTVQFAWVNTLLIGMAAHYKQDFSGAHVVFAVQSFARGVEHYPYYVLSLLHHFRTLQLNTLNGMAVLLRN
jgi:lysine-N-methylase